MSLSWSSFIPNVIILKVFFIPKRHYLEGFFFFRNVIILKFFIPKGCYLEVFFTFIQNVMIPKVLILKHHDPEVLLLQNVIIFKVIYSET